MSDPVKIFDDTVVSTSVFGRKFEIATLVAIVGLVVAILVPFVVEIWKQSRIELTLRVNATRSLVAPSLGSEPGVNISFQGRPVERPWLVVVTLENSANAPVKSEDIRVPLTLRFNRSSLLRASVISTQPRGVEAILEVQAAVLRIGFDLLNVGESITLELLFDGEPSWTDHSLRIVGGEPLRLVTDGRMTATLGPVWPQMPALASWMVLAAATIGAALFAFVAFLVSGFALAESHTKAIRPDPVFDLIIGTGSAEAKAKAIAELSPNSPVSRLFPLSFEILRARRTPRTAVELTWIDAAERILSIFELQKLNRDNLSVTVLTYDFDTIDASELAKFGAQLMGDAEKVLVSQGYRPHVGAAAKIANWKKLVFILAGATACAGFGFGLLSVVIAAWRSAITGGVVG